MKENEIPMKILEILEKGLGVLLLGPGDGVISFCYPYSLVG